MNFDFIKDLKDDEVVRPLQDAPRGYFITNYGRVYAQGPGLGKKGRWLKPCKNSHASGYRFSYFIQGKTRSVHREVARHFIEDYNPLLYVCHKDESLQDERSFHVSNLFLGTASDNMIDMVKKGRHQNQWTK